MRVSIARSNFACKPAGNSVISSYTVTKPGFDVGAGLAFGGFKHGRFFAEAKWERAFLNYGNRIDLVPVTFGFAALEIDRVNNTWQVRGAKPSL